MRIFLILVLIFLLGLLVLALLPGVSKDVAMPDLKPYPVEAVQNDIRDVTPEYTLPGPVISDGTISRLPDVPAPPSVHKNKNSGSNIQRNVIVMAAGIIRVNDSDIFIAGITPLQLEEKCATKSGAVWPCGRFARTALRAMVRARAVECDNTPAGDEPLLTNCRVGNRDIGAWLVSNGWARDNSGRFNDQMRAAKEAQTGMWRISMP